MRAVPLERFSYHTTSACRHRARSAPAPAPEWRRDSKHVRGDRAVAVATSKSRVAAAALLEPPGLSQWIRTDRGRRQLRAAQAAIHSHRC